MTAAHIGSDTLTGGTGTDTLDGGTGDDTYVNPLGDTIVELGGGGLDSVQSDAGFTLPDEVERLFLTGTAAEVTPVSEIGPYRFEVGEITQNLMNDYSAAVTPAQRAAAE